MSASREAVESSGGPLHVLVVDDSAVVRQVLGGLLAREPAWTVDVAADPFIAKRKMGTHRPDVIILDLNMPRQDGLSFLAELMATDPLPVVICSEAAAQGTDAALRALEAGAVDIVVKPRVGVRDFLEESAVMLVDAVRAAAQARSSVRRRGGAPAALPAAEGPSPKASWPPAPAVAPPAPPVVRSRALPSLVAIGASTGGTDAIARVLQPLSVHGPPIVMVQHMPEGFTTAFAGWLDQLCAYDVREARDGEPLRPGVALLAPGNHHLEVAGSRLAPVARVFSGPLVSRHRPSVNVLFRSVARVVPGAMGILLTGMGDDGAEGLLSIRQAGGVTAAQDEASCVVFGMPREAIRMGAAELTLPLDKMAALIQGEKVGR